MTPLECLRQHGALEAAHIAEAIHMPLEAVYEALVAAEARGEAKVVVHTPKHGQRWCEWEACDA